MWGRTTANWLTPNSQNLLERLTVAELLKNFPIFYET
jgi:hypothetical protein